MTLDYRRFMDQWAIAYSADNEFRGVPFPSNTFELPSPELLPGSAAELGTTSYGGLHTVPEPFDTGESDATP